MMLRQNDKETENISAKAQRALDRGCKDLTYLAMM